uniref:Protein kinase domain-containing protein n=1 Tax=Picea sitchensis TaxID=3332 RepID=D5AA69_PICSI|nr:unknown [Picea sitchensis]
MMEKSVLMVVLIVGAFVFGEFKHAIAERSGGKYHLPQRARLHSPSYAPVHSSKSQSPQRLHSPSYTSVHSPKSQSPQRLHSPSNAPVHSPKSQSPHHPPYSSLIMVPGPAVLPSIRHSSAPSTRIFISPSLSPSFLSAAKSVAPMASMSTSLQQAKSLKSTKQEMQHLKVLSLVAIPITLLILGAILLFTYYTWVSRSRLCPVLPPSQPQALRKQSDNDDSDANNGMSIGPFLTRLSSFRTGKRKGCASAIEYSVLQAATNNFSSYNFLGKGGFGSVYRAQFHDDFCVAVKMLDENRKQADNEFQSEVELMSKIRHPNLVSLLGFCVHGKTRLLVYELMQNGSLEEHLHGPSHGAALTWHLRMKIALDTARGLEHLHEHCNSSIIHSDFKSANILLDASFNAKLSDFGLAVRAGGCICSTDVELLGTLGYLAPEYLFDGKLTEKSDVYAFGVVLLELITGRKPVDKSMPAGCQSLVTWAKPQLTDRSKLPTIVDPMIKETMHLKHLYQVAAVAVLCVQNEPDYRPLITDVAKSLMPLVPVELGGALKNAKALSATEMKPLVAANLSTKTTEKTELKAQILVPTEMGM